MKKRLKKKYRLNKKFAKKYGGGYNCIICGLGYVMYKTKPRTVDVA